MMFPPKKIKQTHIFAKVSVAMRHYDPLMAMAPSCYIPGVPR